MISVRYEYCTSCLHQRPTERMQLSDTGHAKCAHRKGNLRSEFVPSERKAIFMNVKLVHESMEKSSQA